ncbi:MarR family transcriptional regulator [Streptomyces sp. NBC_00212]|uniref:MarR family winged helix-turn-helix transcriptional regulator n=1 Tax=Streptomyces sp. NBC_00212 TaxID=2975684 RepID=UPI002F91408E
MNTTARAANPSEPPHGILPDEVFDPILRIAHVLNKAVGRLLHPYRMSCSDASVLAVLHRSGPPHALAPTDIARCLALTSGALTPRIDRLEDAGLVERLPVPADRRRTQVRLTHDGHNRAAEIISQVNLLYEAVLSHALDPRLEPLVAGLGALDKATSTLCSNRSHDTIALTSLPDNG